jgi:hypothetical protein
MDQAGKTSCYLPMESLRIVSASATTGCSGTSVQRTRPVPAWVSTRHLSGDGGSVF